MEKLNAYLRLLLSSCSDELRLEPDMNPYLVSGNRNTDIANVPMLGTQISTMVFPLIPPGVRSTLPNRSEVDFVYADNLGEFQFNVKKSSAGFVVTVRPTLGDGNEAAESLRLTEELPSAAPAEVPEVVASTAGAEQFGPAEQADEEVTFPFAPQPERVPEPATAGPASYEFESSSLAYESASSSVAEISSLPDLMYQEAAAEYGVEDDGPEIEVISFNDPAYQTVFSDTATYEPPGRRDDFTNDQFVAPAFDNLKTEDPIGTAEAAEVSYEGFQNNEPPTQTPLLAPSPGLGVAKDTSKMDELFQKMSDAGASDLHLSVSMPPMIRKDGQIKPLEAGMTSITADAMRELLTSIMPGKNQEEFAARNDSDFAYEIPELARFRCNVFMDRKGMGGVFRIIPARMTTAEKLGLSKAILDLTTLSKGLVVVTGPTGSGKSTTLCAMVNHINLNREDHIITIEDPIEFVHDNHKCLVNQREVHNHTSSFKDALRAALREDPDILLVGEMRDLETISIAIETAETGHLVFGTLHTTTAASTVDRIIDQFPADRQQQIRVMLSESLKGVIAQTLLPKKGGGRVAALEVLIVTPAISNLIREGKTFQIPSAMQTGKNLGMVMLNDALFEHVKNGTVEPMDAYIKAVDKTGFETLLTRGGFKL